MNTQVIFRHISKSPSLSKYAVEKIADEIFGRFSGLSNARVVFSKEGDRFAVRCCLYDEQGAVTTMNELADDAYVAVDSAVEKIASSISRSQEKRWRKSRHFRIRPEIQYFGAA